MRPSHVALSLSLTLALGLAACSEPDTPGTRAAHARHENFEAIGGAFKTVSEQLKGDAPEVAKIRVAASTISGLAPKVESWFPKGSGPQDEVKTDALETVWTKPAEFRHAAEKFIATATTLDAAAKGEDVAAMRNAAQDLGGACKGCHEAFREKD